jgi:hypothetical protein
MATAEQVRNLHAALGKITALQDVDLTKRPAWGEINFVGASEMLKNAFGLVGSLSSMPLEFLPESACPQVQPAVDNLQRVLTSMNQFSLTSVQNPPQARDDTLTKLKQATEELFLRVGQWIPFLAYQKGDVSANITRLSAAVQQAEILLRDAGAACDARAKEIAAIIDAARNASAGAGAAVFTKDFEKESSAQRSASKPWLFTTAALGICSVAVAILTWFWTQPGLDQGQIWQKISSKVIVLSVLITATLWCGRIYKALMHQATVNKHRALGLLTFQAFRQSAVAEETKDAVLKEACRAIFQLSPTGYIPESGGADSDTRIVEFVRAFSGKDGNG